MNVPHIILASNSPRRKQLIQLLDLPFEIFPADIDETRNHGEAAKFYVKRLAHEKALWAAEQKVGLIIAADTIVVDGDVILGKPLHVDEARSMLLSLRGHQHHVLTAIALIDSVTGRQSLDLCCTAVPMRDYSDDEIDAYIKSGDPLDKAGAYAIQHQGFNPVEKMDGCFASVMGFPLCHVVRNLRQMDFNSQVDVPAACQKALTYNCPVYERILENV